MAGCTQKLAITDLAWNGQNQPEPGTSLTFLVTVQNKGETAAPKQGEQTTVTVFVDTEVLQEVSCEGGFAAGESKTFVCQPWVATPGNHVITASLNGAVATPSKWGNGEQFVRNLRVAKEALPVPAPAAAAGMNMLTFSDDFATLDTIDVNATGARGYKWYPTRPYGATTLKPSDYEITADGILLKEEKSTFNYGLAMLDMRTGAGWGYTHGYMEARFRMPSKRLVEGGKGSPAIWALPPEKLWSRCNEWLELDFMEYWGNIFSEDLLYTVTMHHQACEKENDIIFWARNHKTSHHLGLGDGDWHVMGWLWAEGMLTTYLDGEEVMTQRWSKEGYPEPECCMNKGELVPGVFSLLDKQVLPITISGAQTWPLEVDYLNIWQAE